MLQCKIKFQKKMSFLILNVMFWLIVIFTSNNKTFADIHQQTLPEITNNISDQSSGIHVGKSPKDIASSESTIYVANLKSDSVSVIDANSNTKIKDIPVGDIPTAIGINLVTNTTYVANYGNDTVSVIDANKNNTKIKDIPVGVAPTAIGINFNTNTVYVANLKADSVSVIDPIANKAIEGRVVFDIEPFNSGHIECENDKIDKDKLLVPLSKNFYLYDGVKCIAKPNQGFEFVSWQENLQGNSTQLLKIASSPSILDSILDFFHMKPDRPEATFAISKSGSFVANFKGLPPPVPAEYITTLFSVVVTAFVGTWLTPTVIAWRKSKNQGKKLDYYFHEINSLQNDGKLDKKDIDKLDRLRKDITNEYTKGKINKEQFDKLVDETSIKYREIFKNNLASLNDSTDKGTKLDEIKRDIEDIHGKGEINNEQFLELNKEISIYYLELYKNKIDSLQNISDKEKEKQLRNIKDNIENAYAKEKINELHYSLLKEKLSKCDKQ
jgi:YVTN family beta-propeller protein